MRIIEVIRTYWPRILFYLGLFLVETVVLFLILVKRPQIKEVNPNVILVGNQFNDDNSITINGDYLDGIIAVYINGIWEPNCLIKQVDAQNISVTVPSDYYSSKGGFSLQLQKKVNSDIFAKSNKIQIDVVENNDVVRPKIVGIYPEEIDVEDGLFQTIMLEGENITEESVVYVNDIPYETTKLDDKLYVNVPFYALCKDNCVYISITQYYNGFPTKVKSDVKYINVINQIKGDNHNEDIMIKYLNGLVKKDYIVCFSVKDESSNAMTDAVIEAMHNIGLEEDIRANGGWQSYGAIIDAGQNVFEKIDTERISYDNLVAGHEISILSANANVGNEAFIIIDGTDYSVNSRGLNIVVFDKNSNKVVDSVCFDGWFDLSIQK